MKKSVDKDFLCMKKSIARFLLLAFAVVPLVLSASLAAIVPAPKDVVGMSWRNSAANGALAEIAWTGPGVCDFADFCKRMEIHRRRLVAAKVNCAPLGDGR